MVKKIFWFRDFMTNFLEMAPQLVQKGCSKKFQTSKISTYYISFNARGLGYNEAKFGQGHVNARA